MQPVSARYETVKRLSRSHALKTLCETLEISRSGYYAWLNWKPGKRMREDTAIRREILTSHSAAPTYGVDNIHADVREKLVCGRNRIRRLMREMGIQSRRKRKYKATTNSNHNHSVSPNLLKTMTVTKPNQVWVSDISYIQTREGWLYLAIVKDLFTREIVGYATGDRITSSLTESALENAVLRYSPARGLICHSDRGVQYCCVTYRALLQRYGFVSSMSRKGNPYDNAVAENFFSCIKCEMIYLNTFETRRDAVLAVFQYIDGFYNRRRRHEALGRVSPHEFRRRWVAASVGSRWRVPACENVARGQGFKRSGP
jgi:transposase InsO family protein